jgi:uncharacterized membrane protein YhaH (DUF805 family)
MYNRKYMLPEHGIVSFIRMKISSGISPQEIKGMLLRAGFHSDNIDHAFRFVKEKYSESHQDLVASNDYLPEISKEGAQHATIVASVPKAPALTDSDTKPSLVAKTALESKVAVETKAEEVRPEAVHSHRLVAKKISKALRSKMDDSFVTHKGLFQGRLRRKDFTLGFLFFFAVGYVVLTMSAVSISLMSPELWSVILRVVEHDSNGVLLVTVPVVLAPITVMMLSLITRRLHNLGLPGSLSWIFLALFVPLDIALFPGMGFLYVGLGILFIVLLAKKGVPEANEYGDFPDSKGSFFKRIFNV